MIRSRRLVAVFILLIGTMLLSACQTFENPLNWSESPMAGQLVGTWRAVEGEDRLKVSRTDIGALRFEEASSDGGDPPDTFIADLLASGSVHVLQVRMDTFSEDGRRPEGKGFGFLRVTQGAKNSVLVQGIDVGMFGRVAEEELRLTVYVSATANGKKTATVSKSGFQIHGQNPSRIQVLSGAILQEVRAVAWKESDHRQFKTTMSYTGVGLPLYGSPDGWGSCSGIRCRARVNYGIGGPRYRKGYPI